MRSTACFCSKYHPPLLLKYVRNTTGFFAFILHVCSLWQDFSVCAKNVDCVTLTFDPTFENKLNLRHNFLTKRDRLYITCGYSLWTDLPVGTKHFDLDFWPNSEKKLTLGFTFDLKEIGFSYHAWIFLVARPFCPYQNFYPLTLTSNFYLILKKKTWH